jgi:hypothetical protein
MLEKQKGVSSGGDQIGYAVAVDVHEARVGRGQTEIGTVVKHYRIGIETTVAIRCESELEWLVNGEQIDAPIAVQVGEGHVLALEIDSGGRR